MPVINDLLVDQFYRTDLIGTVEKDATTIRVKDASGFPQPSSLDTKYFYLTLVKGDVAEILKVTDVTGNTLTVDVGPTQTFLESESRAEHWFTARAFQDIQNFLKFLGDSGTSYPGPDFNTINVDGGGLLQVAKVTDNPGVSGLSAELHLKEEGKILQGHLFNGPIIDNNRIVTGTIEDGKIATGIDAAKIASLLGSKLPVNTIPEITFAQIDYTVGTPSGGVPGDIFIEWEDYVA